MLVEKLLSHAHAGRGSFFSIPNIAMVPLLIHDAQPAPQIVLPASEAQRRHHKVALRGLQGAVHAALRHAARPAPELC